MAKLSITPHQSGSTFRTLLRQQCRERRMTYAAFDAEFDAEIELETLAEVDKLRPVQDMLDKPDEWEETYSQVRPAVERRVMYRYHITIVPDSR